MQCPHLAESQNLLDLAVWVFSQYSVCNVKLSFTKFVKQYADFSVGVDGLKQYDNEVKSGEFPSEAHTYRKKIMSEVDIND